MRIQAVFGIGLSALATLLWNTQVNADESVDRARQIAETTALVYFKENVSEKERKSVLDDIVFKLSAANKSETAVSSDWFVNEIPFDQTLEAANQEKFKNIIDHVERNSVVNNFSLGCPNSPQTLPAEFVPDGVSRVGGPFVSASGLAVWIVDTGVEVTGPYLPGIDFDRAGNCVASCTQITTGTKDQVADQNGHGTMLAGIIAAKPKNSKGPTGVAPSAIIIPIKITNDDTINKADLEKGIDFVTAHAYPGDVVNLSWGFRVPTPPEDENEWKDNNIEDKLRALANKGIRVVVAAGNWNPNVPELYLTGGSVQLISPARIGSYIPTADAASGAQGGIFTISAVRNDDLFWKDPVSGSFLGNDPPTYAAPGVDIQSLWYMPDKIQTCSGTSFAAAHVSGVLLQDKAVLPATDGTAQGDPSAFDSNNNPVLSQEDPIAICRKTMNTCQPVNH